MKSFSHAAVIFAAMVSIIAPLKAIAQTAAGQETPTTVSLSASGEVDSPPDKATISLGVQTRATTATAAMTQNAQRMSQIITALKAAGLPAKAIQTSNVSLEPQYDDQPNQPAKLTGYMVSNQVTITVDDLARLGATLDAVVSAGANQIAGIGFKFKDPRAAEDAARLAAVKALRAKAELYAAATGYKVGRLLTLNEGGPVGESLPLGMRIKALAYSSAAPTPISPGQLTTRVDVSGIYELDK